MPFLDRQPSLLQPSALYIQPPKEEDYDDLNIAPRHQSVEASIVGKSSILSKSSISSKSSVLGKSKQPALSTGSEGILEPDDSKEDFNVDEGLLKLLYYRIG
jgi:hypothetical protein